MDTQRELAESPTRNPLAKPPWRASEGGASRPSLNISAFVLVRGALPPAPLGGPAGVFRSGIKERFQADLLAKRGSGSTTPLVERVLSVARGLAQGRLEATRWSTVGTEYGNQMFLNHDCWVLAYFAPSCQHMNKAQQQASVMGRVLCRLASTGNLWIINRGDMQESEPCPHTCSQSCPGLQ